MEVNAEKMNIFFFNYPEMVQNHLSKKIGFGIGHLLSKYLGVSLVLHHNRLSTWEDLIGKTCRKVNN